MKMKFSKFSRFFSGEIDKNNNYVSIIYIHNTYIQKNIKWCKNLKIVLQQTFFSITDNRFSGELVKRYEFILEMEGAILWNIQQKKNTFLSSSLNINNNVNFMMSFQFNILLVLFASSSVLYYFNFYIHFLSFVILFFSLSYI